MDKIMMHEEKFLSFFFSTDDTGHPPKQDYLDRYRNGKQTPVEILKSLVIKPGLI